MGTPHRVASKAVSKSGTGIGNVRGRRPPVVLIAGRYSVTAPQARTDPPTSPPSGSRTFDPEVFADEAFSSIWNDEYLQRVQALTENLPEGDPWRQPPKDRLHSAAILEQCQQIDIKLSMYQIIPPIPVPFNVALQERHHEETEEERARQDRQQGLFDFMRSCSPLASICALPAQAAVDFLATLDPLPLPVLLTVATNRTVTQPDPSEYGPQDRTHVVRLPPSNKLQAQAIRERVCASLTRSERLAYIFRTNFSDLYSRDLAEETERALQGSGIAVRHVASQRQIEGRSPVVVSIGYKSTLATVLPEKCARWIVVQTDGCSRDDAIAAKRTAKFDGRLYVVQPTLDQRLIARHAFAAIADTYSAVRAYPPSDLKDRLAGFRQRVVEKLEDLNRQFRFLDGENVGAWYSVEDAR